jgi:hypothetical protein
MAFFSIRKNIEFNEQLSEKIIIIIILFETI